MAKTSWNKHLMQVYHEMKRKNSKTTLSDAMKKASRSY